MASEFSVYDLIIIKAREPLPNAVSICGDEEGGEGKNK